MKSFNSINAFETIRHLSQDIGARWMGSENGTRAADYIREHFQAMGLEVYNQTFKARGYLLSDWKIEILEPPLGEIPCSPILGSADTTPEGISGEVIYLEGNDETLFDARLSGKIVIWFPIARGSVPKELIKWKPLALIIISNDPGGSPRHDLMFPERLEPYEPVPTFRVSWEDGYKMVQAGVRKISVRLITQRYEGQACNIIGDLKGSEHPEEIIVIGAHYDCTPYNAGATDNASGVAMVMELARVFAQSGAKRTIRFAAWDAEEGGYRGSLHYVQDVKRKEIENNKFKHLMNLNMDVLGMALGYHSCYVNASGEFASAIRVLSKELGISCIVKHDESYGSDGESFLLGGIPAITFTRLGPALNFIHSDKDTIDLVHPKALQEVGELIEAFLERYAINASTWPFDCHVSESQIQQASKMLEKWFRKPPDLLHEIF